MNRNGWGDDADDGELVEACRKGDDAAFELLVRRHQNTMLNLAHRILGDYGEACEVVQDAFLAAHRGLEGFRGEARFSTWLTTITVNRCRNALERLRTRRLREARSLDAPLQGPEGEIRQEYPSGAPSALELLEREALRRRVEKCIAALAPEFREVLVLRDVQDRSYEEIGSALCMREGTVKSRLFRAREGVRQCLKAGAA